METQQQRESRTLGVAAAGIWLGFLVFPTLGVLRRGAEPWEWVAYVVGLAVFVVGYLAPFADARFLSRWHGPMRAVVACLVMAAGAALALPAAGVTVLYIAPYFLAVWCFTQELRVGIPVAVALLVVALGVALVLPVEASLESLVLPLLLSAVPILTMAVVSEQSERVGHLRHQVDVARQREAIARDVHDVLGHSLTVVAVKSELARRLVRLDPERAEAELDDVLRLTRDSLTQVRETVGGLRTPDLGEQLASARTALAAAGIRAHIPGPTGEEVAIPLAQREVFAWCLREAVTNVVRHSGARHCTVSVAPGRLVVEDDGAGIGSGDGDTPGAHAHDGGHGIAGMRERVALLGGALSVGPAQGSPTGTRVEVTV